MIATSKSDSVILIGEEQNIFLPVHADAFQLANGSKRYIDDSYRGVYALFSNGSLKRIDKIEIVGAYGSKPLQRLLNYLNSVWKIKTVFSNTNLISLEHLKRVSCRLLELDHEKAEPFFLLDRPLEESLRLIERAESFEELYSCLKSKDTEYLLDVL